MPKALHQWLEELGFEQRSDFRGGQPLSTIREESRQHMGLGLGFPICNKVRLRAEFLHLGYMDEHLRRGL